jgi:Na+-transporting methylmalonyl-CoA/oxaloacetate decarboxylase gamma subunit
MNNYAAIFMWLLLAIVAVSLVFLVIIGVSVIAIMKKMCVGQERPYQREDTHCGTAQTQAPFSAGTAPAPTDDDDEIVAVITAAINALCGQSVGIVSITPSQTGSSHGVGSAWRLAGRLQNFEGFSDI